MMFRLPGGQVCVENEHDDTGADPLPTQTKAKQETCFHISSTANWTIKNKQHQAR